VEGSVECGGGGGGAVGAGGTVGGCEGGGGEEIEGVEGGGEESVMKKQRGEMPEAEWHRQEVESQKIGGCMTTGAVQ